jgi:hypothetical protein
MKKWGQWVVGGVIVLALAALVGWANAYTPLMTPRASEEWSRGRLLGVTPVSIGVDVQPIPDGGAFLTWVDLEDRLHVVRVGKRGQIVLDRAPALGTDVPREARVLLGSEDSVHLVWRETAEGRSVLNYARLNRMASVRAGPIALSRAGDDAQSPSIALNSQGEVEVFWVSQAGIYQVTLSAEGEVLDDPALLVERGRDVAVQVDRAGVFHLAWVQDVGSNVLSVFYASMSPEQRRLGQPEEMGKIFLRTGQRLQSLVLGLDADIGYVLWTIQDMKNISSDAQYAFFPLQIPRQKKVIDLQLDEGGNPLSLWAVRGQYETLLVALTQTIMTLDGPQLQIGVIPLHEGQLLEDRLLAVAESRWSSRSRAEFGGVSSVWMSKVFRRPVFEPLSSNFADGLVQSLRTARRPQGEGWPGDQHIVTASDRPCLKPTMAVDAQGDLHLTWLEPGGFGVYRVAYASTAAGVKKAYNALTLWDVTDRVLGVTMQLFLAIGLTPVLAISWSLFPLMWLLGYHLVTGHESLRVLSARVNLSISMLLEVICTYLIYPYRSMMPVVLQWTSPLATGIVALLLTTVCLRKRDEKGLFESFFVFAVVHGLLQVVLFVLLQR